MKKIILLLIFSISYLIEGNTQDIVLLKKNGGAMEGYFQKITKENIYVKFGMNIFTIDKKSVKIIIGIPYDNLKKEGLLQSLHNIDDKNNQIRKAIRKSRKEIRRKERKNRKE